MPITVRPVCQETFEPWLAMRMALYGADGLDDATNRAEAREIMDAGRLGRLEVGCLIAFDAERPVGMAEVSVRDAAEFCDHSPVGYLEGWYVEFAHRGRGVGTELVRAAGDWARRRGCRQLASDTQDWNADSASAHAGCGFRDMGLLRHFVRDL